MKAVRVRVENGRVSGDAPAGLPDGEVDLCLVDDDEDESTRSRRHRIIDATAY